MDRAFKIRNWDRFQFYKQRNPPWIKLHYEILSSRDWVGLKDKDRLTAIVAMLVASRRDGMVPDDPEYLKRVAYLDHLPDLQPLVRSGFLVPADGLHTDACKRMQPHASVCSESETETETEKTPPHPAEAVAAVDLLIQLMKENDPNTKTPKPKTTGHVKWCQSMWKIHRIDNRPWKQIMTVISWCQKDSFWQSNILSPAKLRKQFTALLLRMNEGQAGGSTNASTIRSLNSNLDAAFHDLDGGSKAAREVIAKAPPEYRQGLQRRLTQLEKDGHV